MKKFVKLSEVKKNSALLNDEMRSVRGGENDDGGELICYGAPVEENPWDPQYA
ncbi:MAG: hypothetical protein GY757_58940 [bacterium]|nr:hypothetical protein [bacterium]